MMTNLKYWLKGLAVAATSMIIYAVALGCYIALMLLVISMEEGGDNLSALSISLTEALILLSQGTGFKSGAITLTIIPLSLTVLLIALIGQVAARFGTDWRGFVSGLTLWELMNVFFMRSVEVGLVDSMTTVIVKTAIVFAIGHAVAAIPQAEWTRDCVAWLTRHVSSPVRRTMVIGSALGLLLVAVYLVVGLIAVIFWAISNQSAVARLYELSGMQNGSRILTTISMLAWLPNLMIWAVSWAFGAGFSIGDLAEFTLWSGQGTGLPALPIFGLFPQAIEMNWVRIALMCIPLATAFVMGMVVMLFNKGFHIRIGGSEQDIDVRHVVMSFAYPIAAFSIASAVVSVVSSLLFSLSDGGLGTKHLAHVGVDAIASTRKVGQPTAVGLFSAWLLTLVAVSIFFAVRWMIRRIRERGRGNVVSDSTKTSREETRASRTVASKNNNKEDQGDNNESTDTTGSGISLP